jgi:hypothetical protein
MHEIYRDAVDGKMSSAHLSPAIDELHNDAVFLHNTSVHHDDGLYRNHIPKVYVFRLFSLRNRDEDDSSLPELGDDHGATNVPIDSLCPTDDRVLEYGYSGHGECGTHGDDFGVYGFSILGSAMRDLLELY